MSQRLLDKKIGNKYIKCDLISEKTAMENLKFVSIIIPCYNEKEYIEKCLESILENDYPDRLSEVLIIDGMSDDGTREIINDFITQHKQVCLIDNPERIKPRALNIGIANSSGDIIIRMDAHAIYEKDYISKCVRYLIEFEVDNVGGLRKTLPGSKTIIARAIAESISSPFAAGNATYRIGAANQKLVDTVFGGCYHKETFEKIGLFNEKLIRGQDREFNIRLKRSGGKILFSPDIVCYYFARSDLLEFIEWIYKGGMTSFFVSKIVGYSVLSWRSFVPPLFVFGIIVALPISLLSRDMFLIVLTISSIYMLLNLLFSVKISVKAKDLRLLFIMPLIFFLTHLIYGIGSYIGIFRPVSSEIPWGSS